MVVRKLILSLALVLGTSCVAMASDCTAGSLAAYMAGGSCTIGNLTFSNFSYSSSSTATSAISASDITVDPNGLGLLFEAPWLVGAGQSLESDIGYTVTADVGSSIVSLVATMFGYGTYAGGTLSLVGNLTSSGDPTAFAMGGGLVTISDSSLSATSATLLEQIILSGHNGQSSLSYFTGQWGTATVTPEPGSLFLLGSGLVGLGGYLRRRRSVGRQ